MRKKDLEHCLSFTGTLRTHWGWALFAKALVASRAVTEIRNIYGRPDCCIYANLCVRKRLTCMSYEQHLLPILLAGLRGPTNRFLWAFAPLPAFLLVECDASMGLLPPRLVDALPHALPHAPIHSCCSPRDPDERPTGLFLLLPRQSILRCDCPTDAALQGNSRTSR